MTQTESRRVSSAQRPERSCPRPFPKMAIPRAQRRKAGRCQYTQVRRVKTPVIRFLYDRISIHCSRHILTTELYAPTTQAISFIHYESKIPSTFLPLQPFWLLSLQVLVSQDPPQILPLAKGFSRSPKPNIISCQPSCIYCLELANVSYIWTCVFLSPLGQKRGLRASTLLQKMVWYPLAIQRVLNKCLVMMRPSPEG